MSQILEVEETKSALRELLESFAPEVGMNAAPSYPQHTFRLGFAEPESDHTPRRPLAEVLS